MDPRPRKMTVTLLLACGMLAHASAQSIYPGSPALGVTQPGVSERIPSNSVSHISVSGTSLWIGTGNGLGRTPNGGRSWQNYNLTPEFKSPGIYAIASKGDTVWCSTGYTKEVNDQSVQTGSGFAFTTDNGQSWSSALQPLDARGDSVVSYGANTVHFLPIVVPEQNVTFDVALTDSAVWVASWSSGLRKSTDGGKTWQRTVLPSKPKSSIAPSDSLGYYSIDPRKDNNFLAFAVAVENGSTIWAGTAGGVNKSTDGGISWRKFSTDNEDHHILSDWVIAIGIQRLRSGTRIWTTNWPTEGPTQQYGVSFTDDGGLTWKNCLYGVKAYDFAFRDSTAYVATGDGLFRTSDGGSSWTQSGSIVDAASGNRVTSPVFFAAGVQADTVFAGSSDGLVRTIDNAFHLFGQEWQVLRTAEPLPGKSSTYAYPNPFSPKTESTRFHYSMESGTSTVSIEIFDFGMNRVRTLVKDATRSEVAERDEIWDGRTDAGNVSPNGVYFYRVIVGGGDPVWGKVMVLQ
jgi:BNR/Asp-box repeat